MAVRRIALGLEYDGQAFAGWQTQPHRRTVQDVLEAALGRFCGEPVATVCAGRTDAGVHARGQVVHFDTPLTRAGEAWVRGVNHYLPPAVAVRWSRAVDAQFHARYSARRREYEYWILNDRVRAPLLAGRTGWVFRPLDAPAMQAAADCLLGTHDFSAFRSAECQAATAVRTVSACAITIAAPGLVRVHIAANAFLHHMVRNLVGALVEVGVGRQPPAWLAQVLAGRDRSRAAATFAADGLYLTAVEYDPAFGLPAGAAGLFPWIAGPAPTALVSDAAVAPSRSRIP